MVIINYNESLSIMTAIKSDYFLSNIMTQFAIVHVGWKITLPDELKNFIRNLVPDIVYTLQSSTENHRMICSHGSRSEKGNQWMDLCIEYLLVLVVSIRIARRLIPLLFLIWLLTHRGPLLQSVLYLLLLSQQQSSIMLTDSSR
jgi:hypothetical protein